MKKEARKNPFFKKFLEHQLKDEAVKGGATMKYPSDSDEDVTRKWPSDYDEDVTMKYPSDGDDYLAM